MAYSGLESQTFQLSTACSLRPRSEPRAEGSVDNLNRCQWSHPTNSLPMQTPSAHSGGVQIETTDLVHRPTVAKHSRQGNQSTSRGSWH